MKFTCNNCGFTAEVPNKMNACPMCASQNVSFKEDVSDEKEERKVKNTAQILEGDQSGAVKPEVAEKKAKGEKKPGKITLNDEFFESKPDREHEEVAKIIKELYPETNVDKGGKGSLNLGLIGGVAGGIIVVAVVLAFLFAGEKDTDDGREESFAAVETEKKPVEKKEQQTEQPAEEDISEIEEEIEEEIAKEMERIKAEEEALAKQERESQRLRDKAVAAKRRAASQKRRAVAAKPAPKPVAKPAPKPVAKPAPAPNPTEIYNTHLQAGHKAVSERRFNDALREYTSASKARPREGTVYKFLGITHAHMQNQKQACVNYRKYIQLSPNAPDKAQVEALIEACP